MDKLVTSVRQLRSRLSESQQAFANRLGISSRAVANYEAGRRPTRAVLFSLAMLAGQAEHPDLSTIFLEAYNATMRGLTRPANDEEQAWVRMVLTLLRNGAHIPELKDLGIALLRATERLISPSVKGKTLATDPDEIKEAVSWASRHIAPNAEQQLTILARGRSGKTGEPFATAFTQVLLENPVLYQEYQRTLGMMAPAVKIAGTPEKGMATRPRKTGRSKK